MEIRKIQTLEELRVIAEEILLLCGEKDSAQVVGLSGDLGVGKTAFVKELAKLLGVGGEITSPTFVIMKSYTIPSHAVLRKLTHIDAYRIESDDEIRVLGFTQLIKDPTRLICIEWPEKIQNLMPADTHMVHFVLNNDGTRDITFGK